jgi:Protein of unknown function (DUF3237)
VTDAARYELPSPSLSLVVQLAVTIDPVVVVGPTWRGRRRIVPITGGGAYGPAFTGEILPGGADVQLVRPDDVTDLTARYLLRTPSGSTVFVENHGLRHAPPEEFVDPALVYFRSEPRFETDDPSLAWLERDLFVGVGARFPDTVRIDVYRVG